MPRQLWKSGDTARVFDEDEGAEGFGSQAENDSGIGTSPKIRCQKPGHRDAKPGCFLSLQSLFFGLRV